MNIKKAIGLNKKNSNIARASHFCVLYFCRHCMTTKWYCLNSCFIESVIKPRRISLSLFWTGKFVLGIQLPTFHIKWASRDNRTEVSKNVKKLLFKWRSHWLTSPSWYLRLRPHESWYFRNRPSIHTKPVKSALFWNRFPKRVKARSTLIRTKNMRFQKCPDSCEHGLKLPGMEVARISQAEKDIRIWLFYRTDRNVRGFWLV